MIKKMTSREDEEKKKRRNQFLVGGFLIFIMLFSVIGYSFQGKDETTQKVNYRGHEFINQEGYWFVKIGELNFKFVNNPKQVEKINSQINYINQYSGKPLYINSESYEAEAEIGMNLNDISQRIQKACLNTEKCDNENLPIKTCEDNFIIIKESNSTGLKQEENCVFISGKKEDLVKISDEFLFKILGIEQ